MAIERLARSISTEILENVSGTQQHNSTGDTDQDSAKMSKETVPVDASPAGEKPETRTENPQHDKPPDGMTLMTVNASAYPVTLAKSAYKRKMKLASHRPEDFSDLGQAKIFAGEYADTVRWNAGTGFLVYDGRSWERSDDKARLIMQNLTDVQMSEAKARRTSAEKEKQEAEARGNKEMIENAKAQYGDAVKWFNDVLGRRNTNRITNALKEAAPMLGVPIEKLDSDPFLLNTPSGTVDLRTGELKEFNPADMCTKIAGVGPGQENREMFEEFLSRLTCGDTALQSYLQEVVGMCAVGKVFTECLIICQGSGGNGKSTFWNLMLKVLGDYGTTVNSDALTDKFGVNHDAFNVELLGRRLAIYPELNEGLSLDMGQVKKIASTEEISVNPKFKPAFKFTPSHTPVLYTNPLPTVRSRNDGTWDRLVMVPFRARFRGMPGEIKDYADYLYKNCGGAVMSWIIEGARHFIANDCKLSPPECVTTATESFHQKNDWFRKFTQLMCEFGDGYKIEAGDFFKGFDEYRRAYGEPYHNIKEFAEAYQAAGLQVRRRGSGKVVFGIRLKETENFVQVDMGTPFDEDGESEKR